MCPDDDDGVKELDFSDESAAWGRLAEYTDELEEYEWIA
jgi:hypothetical protein